VQSRWKEQSRSELERLAYATRLIGLEKELVLHGGGNSSLKTIVTDPLGRRLHVMYVKPSGMDMATMSADEFTALRLEDLEPLLDRDPLTDSQMATATRRAQLDPDAPPASIEAKLHAFLPDRWILHSHADALLALSNRPDGATRLLEILGSDVVLVNYRRPGSKLAHEVGSARRNNPAAKAIVLMNHGLVTYGADPREVYENHIDIVTRCENAASLPPFESVPPSDRERALELAPQLRGRLGGNKVLLLDDSEETCGFVSTGTLLEASQRGPATADHILRTGRIPCVLRDLGDLDSYKDAYRAYAESGERDGLDPFDPEPKVVLAPGVGMFTSADSIERATIARDIYRQTMQIIRRAEGAWDPIDKQHQHHAEYWPLQARKQQPEPGELAGKIAWISGAASGIGHSVTERFLEEGAHVVLTDLDDIDLSGPRVLTLTCDVSDPAQVEASFEQTVLAFGGVDIVVSNAGIARPALIEELSLKDWERSFAVNATSHFLVARAAMRILRAQGLGGSIVFNASKNVLAPGKGFAAYSASKAAEAQFAKVLAIEAAEIGVRVNTLHPDAVFAGTRLWSDSMREERAKAHGVDVAKIEEFYAQRNLLKCAVRPEDVAEAALFFASERSSRTTGAYLTIDGGVKEAFGR